MKIDLLIPVLLLSIEVFLAIAIKMLFFENYNFIDYFAHVGCIMIGTIIGSVYHKIK
jgi:membrane associated rhomboid family serine protease